MNRAKVSRDRRRLQEIGKLANSLAREFAEFGERVSATLTADARPGEDAAASAEAREIAELLARAPDAWERTLHRMAVTAAERTQPRDATAGQNRIITAFLVAKPAFPQTEVLEIRRGLNSNGGPGKLLALVDDRAANAAL